MKSAPAPLRLLAYFSAVVLMACLISPPLYWAGNALAEGGVLPFLKGFPFHRYFSRSLQISALLMLWPAFRWVGIRSAADLGLEPNPMRWRDFAVGVVAALLPVVLLAVGYLGFGVYGLKNNLPLSGVLRVLVTAPVVAVVEEFLFRGVLLGLCLRSMRPFAAVLVSSAAFAVVHFMRVAKPAKAFAVGWASGFEQLPLAFSSAPAWPLWGWGMLALLAAGLILACATMKTKSLSLAIGVHAGWVLGQQGLQFVAKFRVKPPGALLPWVGPNVVSGAVPTGLVSMGALLIAAIIVCGYVRYARFPRCRS